MKSTRPDVALPEARTQTLVAEHVLPPPSSFPHVPGCRIVSEIACGGMAVLYRGVQENLGRPVAVKALRSDVNVAFQNGQRGTPNWRDRFVREARILALLEHDNLVRVHDLVPSPSDVDGPLYIIMELCEGIDLLDVLTAHPTLPCDVAASIALGASGALCYIHRRGILHRDVKPANLFLLRTGGVKLLDFGTAWDPMNPIDLRGDEVGLGTPSYMSPEQALGQPLDARCDQLALGIVLYQMLAGRKPFIAPSDQGTKGILYQVVHTPPPPLASVNPNVPKKLLRIVERCLQKSPNDRYSSTEELRAALIDFVGRRADAKQIILRFLLEKQLLPAGQLVPASRENDSSFGRFGWLRRLFEYLRAVEPTAST